MIQKFTIIGLVQGIGYRPFVARIAEELNISGWVRNTGGIVTVLASGSEESLREFHRRLSCDVPTGGFVNNIEVQNVETEAGTGFQIIESDSDQNANLPLIPADIATCDNCKEELLDPSNRRYGHPFISCTVCGPRYSIIEKLPYDRNTITMDDFEMCPECKNEYIFKADRRRHAQTIACHKCGPKLEFTRILENPIENDRHDYAGNPAKNDNIRKLADELLENSDRGNLGSNNVISFIKTSCTEKECSDTETVVIDTSPLESAITIIKDGGIIAVKDIGGYHLVCSPFDSKAVAALRLLKHREAKAFAVMFDSVEQIRIYGNVNEQEEALLESPARPIVLIRKKQGKCTETPMADNVCLTSPDIGAMLPCNPVQIMLVKACGPLIMTSGNASGDVLETDDEKMICWLKNRVQTGEFADTPIGILSHNRRILRPMDDSVMKVVKGRNQFIRRGRGHVPNPISVDIEGEILAAGGDLKSSFCYVKNGLAYVSQYLGDLESVSCQRFYQNELDAMDRIFGFNPEMIVADKHVSYFSRNYAEKLAERMQMPITYVQHHKAHVAAVIAEHKLKGPVLGFAFDGTGYGDDGNVWGSEVFKMCIADDNECQSNEKDKISMERVAHLKPVKLIGGDEGSKNCDTILIGMLHQNGIEIPDWLKNKTDSNLICSALDNNINTITSTSMGRLFDVVSAMLDICHYNSYEGQAPVELENMAATTDEYFEFEIALDGDTRSLFLGIVESIENKGDKAKIARGFIYAVADYILKIATRENIKQIVLSGGSFLNRILIERTIENLEKHGFEVYISNQLPPGDGSICLGQAYLSPSSPQYS